MAREERGSPGFHMVVVAVWELGIGKTCTTSTYAGRSKLKVTG
jgi:hypothetical protein